MGCDIRHSLFAEDEDDLDFEDLQGGSIIDLVKNSKEDGEDFGLEDEIDHMVVLMVAVLNKVLEEFSLMPKKVARQVVFSSIAGMTII
ncbi:hypothetical protein L1049_016882 [Liquidambar formosana]|uniref:Uncharacterized protein n=1 Tax=Liquidambar formosana TaxID=63359 RepID=A0AAP0S721_LIQFO